jgi:prepilin-type N-terminal cleavage/methylation domain-containing protein
VLGNTLVHAFRPFTTHAGFTLTEMLVAVTLMLLIVAIAVPMLLTGLDEMRTASAAWHVAGVLRLARMEAVKRSRNVGVRFDAGDGFRYTVYVDGNHNGVRTADIRAGIDRILAPPERIGDRFAGVAFAVVPGVTRIEAGDAAPRLDNPVAVGPTNILSFSPQGTATSGTLYLAGRHRRQFAVRVLGITGRTRVMEFNRAAAKWALR